MPPEGPTVFEHQGLIVFYGAFRAVRDVSLNIRKAITAFIGPSGWDKTTLLGSLNRMHDLVPGTRIEGWPLYHADDLNGPGVDPVVVRRLIGMVSSAPTHFRSRFTTTWRSGQDRQLAVNIDCVEGALRKAALWDEVKDRLRTRLQVRACGSVDSRALSCGRSVRLTTLRCDPTPTPVRSCWLLRPRLGRAVPPTACACIPTALRSVA